MKIRIITFIFLTMLSLSNFAQTSFASPFSNNMVLQRNTAAKIWGIDNPNTSVSITTSWDNQVYNTNSDSEGKWTVSVNTPEGSENAYTVSLQGTQTVTLSNVLIGEVWLASGQSNMFWNLGGTDGGADVAANANDQGIRILRVGLNPSIEKQDDFSGSWTIASGSALQNFSAVAYYYGKMLRDNLEVPIGLIRCARGDTTIEAWMDEETLNNFDFVTVPNELDADRPHRTPTSCFNGMLNPLIGYNIKGTIWYQGEANKSRPNEYAQLFPAMIDSWRNLWDTGDFPFYYVQIVPYAPGNQFNAPFWNMLKNAYYNIDNTGMVVTMDKPSCNEIHPSEKKYVGDRLAYWALNKDYGFSNVVPSGPLATTAQTVDNTIRVNFDYNETELKDQGSSGLTGFEVAGSNGVFYDAQAQINMDNTLTLSSASVAEPQFVRYGYAGCDALEATLFNGAGLPASAFSLETGSLLGFEDNDINKVRAYPIPANNNLYIERIDKKLPVKIYNDLGMLVKTAFYENSIEISDLARGLYILTQEEISVKFIKK